MNTVAILYKKGQSDPDVSAFTIMPNGNIDWDNFSAENLKGRAFAQQFCTMQNHTTAMSSRLSLASRKRNTKLRNAIELKLEQLFGNKDDAGEVLNIFRIDKLYQMKMEGLHVKTHERRGGRPYHQDKLKGPCVLEPRSDDSTPLEIPNHGKYDGQELPSPMDVEDSGAIRSSVPMEAPSVPNSLMVSDPSIPCGIPIDTWPIILMHLTTNESRPVFMACKRLYSLTAMPRWRSSLWHNNSSEDFTRPTCGGDWTHPAGLNINILDKDFRFANTASQLQRIQDETEQSLALRWICRPAGVDAGVSGTVVADLNTASTMDNGVVENAQGAYLSTVSALLICCAYVARRPAEAVVGPSLAATDRLTHPRSLFSGSQAPRLAGSARRR